MSLQFLHPISVIYEMKLNLSIKILLQIAYRIQNIGVIYHDQSTDSFSKIFMSWYNCTSEPLSIIQIMVDKMWCHSLTKLKFDYNYKQIFVFTDQKLN